MWDKMTLHEQAEKRRELHRFASELTRLWMESSNHWPAVVDAILDRNQVESVILALHLRDELILHTNDVNALHRMLMERL